MTKHALIASVVLGSLALTAPGVAQTVVPDAPTVTTPAEKGPGRTSGLSKGAVVHPGDPDPGIAVRPPRAGVMPVVPPPGTFNNHPTVSPR